MTKLVRSSPHCDERPTDSAIKLIVIHNISLPPENFTGPWIDDLFMGRLDTNAHPYFKQLAEVRVSAHLLIRRDGSTIQYVPFQKRAWHAGASSYQGHECCNDFSIGIELEGTDERPYTALQYQKLSDEIVSLIQQFPLISNNLTTNLDDGNSYRHKTLAICGHKDVAPERKTDPGPIFDWGHLFALIDKKS